MAYQLSTNAYIKVMLHVAKYPSSGCHGLLLGESNMTTGNFIINDVIPLFHHQIPLAPLIEIACAMVDTYAKEKKQQIVGYYYASIYGNERIPSMTEFSEKIAEKIEANCSRACVLLVHNDNLSTESSSALQLVLKDVKRGWIPIENRLTIEGMPQHMVTKALKNQSQLELIDFEEHLEDLSKDWRNVDLIPLLKLNA